MFTPTSTPRLFALPPGVDFGAQFLRGLRARFGRLDHVEIYVNTQRMRRRLTDLLCDGQAGLLPRIHLVSDPALDPRLTGHTTSAPLRQKLELAKLVRSFIATQPDLAQSSVFALTDSLIALISEMQDEGVALDTIADLDVSDESGHWARAQSFIKIAYDYAATSGPTGTGANRSAVMALIQRWQDAPPDHPIILAGSTASRGTTALLAQAIAKLPQGAVVFPGYDTDLPAPIWSNLNAALTSEDHPQFRMAHLARTLGLDPAQIPIWDATPPAHPARNALISMALRPAPVTESWLRDGPNLQDLPQATQDITLIEAPSPRIEAQAIALRMRAAAEAGEEIALISPDRALTRMVAAALDRWDLTPDDSAGLPLHLSAPGRLLRDTARFLSQSASAQSLLALLKHPLAHSGTARGEHLRWTRELELSLRRYGPPFPSAASMHQWAAQRDAAQGWANWVGDLISGHTPRTQHLRDHIAAHLNLLDRLSAGTQSVPGKLWDETAGRAALQVMRDLQSAQDAGEEISPGDYAALIDNLLTGIELHDRDAGHPHLLIWGTLEARVQSAPTIILAGLNEGTWPAAPKADPWLNRALRAKAGLLLPDRQIGLAAHDFQQAVAAPRLWISRAIRNDETDTVPARWVNRLTNLLAGLPDGQPCLHQMRTRGAHWIAMAEAQDQPTGDPTPAPRPSPRPPAHARPTRLRVTDIAKLGRDPYEIYTREVLRLSPLDPLILEADARDKGIVIHKAMEYFATRWGRTGDDAQMLTDTLNEVITANCPWPIARMAWRLQLERHVDQIIAQETERRRDGDLFAPEIMAEIDVQGVTIRGRADRIDLAPDGRAILYDYKTGSPPNPKQQTLLDKQLLVEAAMLEQGGFADLGPRSVLRAQYLQIGSTIKTVDAPLDACPPAQTWAELNTLIGHWSSPSRGYTSRMAAEKSTYDGQHDHLARFGEWDESTPPTPQDVG